jgi:hypothetical protein
VQRVYHHSTRVFAVLVMLIGIAMVVGSLARGGGPLSYGVILGVLFTALGAGRLYQAAAPRAQR